MTPGLTARIFIEKQVSVPTENPTRALSLSLSSLCISRGRSFPTVVYFLGMLKDSHSSSSHIEVRIPPQTSFRSRGDPPSSNRTGWSRGSVFDSSSHHVTHRMIGRSATFSRESRGREANKPHSLMITFHVSLFTYGDASNSSGFFYTNINSICCRIATGNS